MTARKNLARSWRPQTFDHVVDQDVPVGMLRNSLYSNHLFPVYLFAGQKGCGKTSTARIFAAALNCAQLTRFQSTPQKQAVPCQSCQSCTGMQNGTHPDFIEIDAASHTGVDDVRNILEACSFMPLLGSKKIYLIDEAHMLSKAAFNALLKILEEPPEQVVFMLATTELHKIPETVQSRCFHLTFNALSNSSLVTHLEKICTTESISFEKAALELLVEQNDGSARDAINALEQVRFSGDSITVERVHDALGLVDAQVAVQLLSSACAQTPETLLALLEKQELARYNATQLWRSLLNVTRGLIWHHYGKEKVAVFNRTTQEDLDLLAQRCSRHRAHAIMQLFWEYDQVFITTSYKHHCIETVLLSITEQATINELKQQVADLTATLSHQPTTPPVATSLPEQPQQQSSAPQSTSAPPPADIWHTFLRTLEQESNDNLIISLLKQAQYLSVNQETRTVQLGLTNNSQFLRDTIMDKKSVWQPILQKTCNADLFSFSDQKKKSSLSGQPNKPVQPAKQPRAVPPERTSPVAPPKRPASSGPSRASFSLQRKPRTGTAIARPFVIAPDEEDKWPQACTLKKKFGGKLYRLS